MKSLKKLIALATVLVLIGSSANKLQAQSDDSYGDEYYGNGYEDSRRVPSLAPAIALGTIAVVAIVAVVVQDNSHHHGHSGHGHIN